MSPEIVSKKEYHGESADIWAVGVVMYVILTGVYPFKCKDEKGLFKKIILGKYSTPTNKNGICSSPEA